MSYPKIMDVKYEDVKRYLSPEVIKKAKYPDLLSDLSNFLNNRVSEECWRAFLVFKRKYSDFDPDRLDARPGALDDYKSIYKLIFGFGTYGKEIYNKYTEVYNKYSEAMQKKAKENAQKLSKALEAEPTVPRSERFDDPDQNIYDEIYEIEREELEDKLRLKR